MSDAEDRLAIGDLLARYCAYADAADTPGWLSLYVEGGVLDMGMGGPPMEGEAALRQFADQRRPGTGVHLSTNAVIDLDGDEATVQSVIVVIGGVDDPHIRLAGRYSDRLRRSGGTWKFASRQLTPAFRRS